MTTPYDHSKSILSGRVSLSSLYPVGIDDYMYSIGNADGLSYEEYNTTFTKDDGTGTIKTYYNKIGLDSTDYYEITQDTDLTGIDVIEGVFRLKLVDTIFSGKQFIFTINIDGAKRAWRILDNRDITLINLKAPCPDLSGTHTISFRLELV